MRHAQAVLTRELQPGERARGSAAVTFSPAPWGVLVLLVIALVLVAAGLTDVLGPWQDPMSASPAAGLAAPLLGLGWWFLARPGFVVATDRRLIFLKPAGFRRSGSRLAFAVPLADVRVERCWLASHRSSIACEIPGRRRIRLYADRRNRDDFGPVAAALAQSGAFTTLDPPYPAS